MSAPLPYKVRILYAFTETGGRYEEVLNVTATDELQAKQQARMVWIDSIPEGRGVQFLGSTAERDNGQLDLL